MAHIARPVIRPVSGIVASIDFGTQTDEQLAAFRPPSIGGAVKGSVSCGFYLVYVLASLDSSDDGCSQRHCLTRHERQNSD